MGSRAVTRPRSGQQRPLAADHPRGWHPRYGPGEHSYGTPVGGPVVLVCRTVKGKGVSFMEGDAGWHGKAPNAEQTATALAELGATLEAAVSAAAQAALADAIRRSLRESRSVAVEP